MSFHFELAPRVLKGSNNIFPQVLQTHHYRPPELQLYLSQGKGARLTQPQTSQNDLGCVMIRCADGARLILFF